MDNWFARSDYGLLAYTVTRRPNEFGVRIALGATGTDVYGMVLGAGLRMAVAGLAIGMLLAHWSSNLAAHVFEDLSLRNPAPIVFAGVTVIVVALIAAYVPARRAARVDPIVALRWE